MPGEDQGWCTRVVLAWRADEGKRHVDVIVENPPDRDRPGVLLYADDAQLTADQARRVAARLLEAAALLEPQDAVRPPV
ncbi:hypothetical protein GCM10009814_14570 [Lapillicoccus jejuensis]